jgi:hypothetical protein
MSDSRCGSPNSENICVQQNSKIYSLHGAASNMFRDGGANAMSSHTNFSLYAANIYFAILGGIFAKKHEMFLK